MCVQHTVSTSHLRHTVILHHSHGTRIGTHARTRPSVGRWMRSNAADILLWIIHHVLRLLAGLLCVVGGLGLGLWRGAIGIEGCRRVPRAISISRRIHGCERLR
jgi:hypothetical protein